MSKFFRHDEYEMIRTAVEDYRDVTAGMVISKDDPESVSRLIQVSNRFATRVEQALRGADWRRVEKPGA